MVLQSAEGYLRAGGMLPGEMRWRAPGKNLGHQQAVEGGWLQFDWKNWGGTVAPSNASRSGCKRAGASCCSFRDNDSAGHPCRHTSLLDDYREWGPVQSFAWQTNVWYWLRLRQEPNAAAQGGANDVFAKIWLADGSAPVLLLLHPVCLRLGGRGAGAVAVSARSRGDRGQPARG